VQVGPCSASVDRHVQGLFYYDPIPGDAEFYATDGEGGIRRTRLHIGFRTSWTKIIPGNFGGDGFTDLLFYDAAAGTGEFYRTDARGRIHLLQTHTGWRETWTQIVPGNFGGSGSTDLLFYEGPTGTGEFYAADGQGGISLLQTHTGWRESWTQIVPGDFGTEGVHLRVHFKSLIPITTAVTSFMDAQYAAMAQLFARNGITVFRGANEDLSGNMALTPLQNLDVGDCVGGETTQEQRDLFANRNNVGANDLVVYVVMSLIGGTGNFVGCAAHPDGRPGAAVVQSSAQWLTAHEVGHVLDLRHVCRRVTPQDPNPPNPCVTGSGQSDRLMFPTTGWTNVPPDIATAEEDTMRNSGLTNAW
jgi:hypothetical protein